MQKNQVAGIVAIGVVILITALSYFRSALTPDSAIRTSLLEQTPLGTEMTEVRRRAEQQGWIAPDITLHSYMSFASGTGILVNAFAGQISKDPFPYRTTVSTTWEFNESNRLVSISVLRHE